MPMLALKATPAPHLLLLAAITISPAQRVPWCSIRVLGNMLESPWRSGVKKLRLFPAAYKMKQSTFENVNAEILVVNVVLT